MARCRFNRATGLVADHDGRNLSPSSRSRHVVYTRQATVTFAPTRILLLRWHRNPSFAHLFLSLLLALTRLTRAFRRPVPHTNVPVRLRADAGALVVELHVAIGAPPEQARLFFVEPCPGEDGRDVVVNQVPQ